MEQVAETEEFNFLPLVGSLYLSLHLHSEQIIQRAMAYLYNAVLLANINQDTISHVQMNYKYDNH